MSDQSQCSQLMHQPIIKKYWQDYTGTFPGLHRRQSITFATNSKTLQRSLMITVDLAKPHQQPPSVLRSLHRSTWVSQHLQLRTEENFLGAKFYCPHALADGNQRIYIREKTLEFSVTVLSTLSQNNTRHYTPVHNFAKC